MWNFLIVFLSLTVFSITAENNNINNDLIRQFTNSPYVAMVNSEKIPLGGKVVISKTMKVETKVDTTWPSSSARREVNGASTTGPNSAPPVRTAPQNPSTSATNTQTSRILQPPSTSAANTQPSRTPQQPSTSAANTQPSRTPQQPSTSAANTRPSLTPQNSHPNAGSVGTSKIGQKRNRPTCNQKNSYEDSYASTQRWYPGWTAGTRTSNDINEELLSKPSTPFVTNLVTKISDPSHSVLSARSVPPPGNTHDVPAPTQSRVDLSRRNRQSGGF